MTKKNLNYLIFCDSSFDPKSKTGVGGTLLASSNELSIQIPISELRVSTKLLNPLSIDEAMDLLLDKLRKSESTAEFLTSMNKG